jgi:hypothetical protein
MTVLVSLVAALRKAAEFNKHELVAPRVILWPDTERLWASCIEAVRGSLPALWTLGDYAPETATGPAAWLRHRLDTHVGDQTPVIYLPGIGRGAFRSADQCPKEATHLFALQFQGQFWSQKNGKDWTPAAFLANAEGGLGLDVAGDQDTRKAIQECLRALVRVEVARLREHRLEAADFRALVTTDPPRTLLRWMGAPDQVKAELGTAEWGTFCAVCRTMYGFEPAGDGPLAAAEKLAQGKGAWPTVWQRYKEAPRSYPGVKELLHAMYPLNLFDQQVEYRPRWNQQAEERLEEGLLGLAEATPKDALAAVQMLAAEHAHRAGWVWAVLGDSPLARAIVHLRDVADVVQAGGSPSTWEGLADYYRSTAWKADYAVLRALAEARSAAATKAVTVAVRAVYLPWLERLATLTQSLMASYPTRGPSACRALAVEAGTVHVFADGLRFDLARALEERIAEAGASITTELRCDWSALPTVTATAKPAFQPLAARLGGPLTGTGFQSKELATGKDLVQARFKQLVAELGMPFLESSDVGLPIGCAWTEHGSVDTYGHEQGASTPSTRESRPKPSTATVVRKDLAQRVQGPVPGADLRRRVPARTLLRQHRRARSEIAEGLEIVQRQLSSRTVRAGEEELFKARAKGKGRVKLIDLVRARLDAKNDCYWPSCPACSSATSASPTSWSTARADADRRLLRRGRPRVRPSIAEEKNGRPFGIESCARSSCRPATCWCRCAGSAAVHVGASGATSCCAASAWNRQPSAPRPATSCCCGWSRSSRTTTTRSSWGRAAPARATCSSRCRLTPTWSRAARPRRPDVRQQRTAVSAAWSASTTSSASTRSPASPSIRRTASTS